MSGSPVAVTTPLTASYRGRPTCRGWLVLYTCSVHSARRAQDPQVGRGDCETNYLRHFLQPERGWRTSFVLRGVSRAIRRATGELLGQVRHLVAQSSHLT